MNTEKWMLRWFDLRFPGNSSCLQKVNTVGSCTTALHCFDCFEWMSYLLTQYEYSSIKWKSICYQRSRWKKKKAVLGRSFVVTTCLQKGASFPIIALTTTPFHRLFSTFFAHLFKASLQRHLGWNINVLKRFWKSILWPLKTFLSGKLVRQTMNGWMCFPRKMHFFFSRCTTFRPSTYSDFARLIHSQRIYNLDKSFLICHERFWRYK